LTISAVSVELTGITSLTIFLYNDVPIFAQRDVIPPITFGVLLVLKFGFPGSILSGLKHKKESFPILKFLFSM